MGSLIDWFAGGDTPYMTLIHCMNHDYVWIGITVALDVAVAAGYVVIAKHWWQNSRFLPPTPAKRALGTMRNIFLFCGICGYLFIPIKMFWPAWRLYDVFMAALVFYTWRYAWGAKDLKVVYNELGRTSRLADELEQSREESRRKTFFLNAISHDLRTPVNGMVLQSHVAEVGLKAGDQAVVMEAIREVRRGADATAGLLDSLLEFARLNMSDQPNVLTDDPLDAVVRGAADGQRSAAAAKGLTLTVTVPPGLRVRTDRRKLERVLTNLLSNAVKFTDAGGVRVECERVGSRGVELHVIDTGPGIPPDAQAKLFEEFFQAGNPERDPRKGFGLGLAIARRLARQLGGDVTVHTADGAGCRFTVALPDCVVGADPAPHTNPPRATSATAAAV